MGNFKSFAKLSVIVGIVCFIPRSGSGQTAVPMAISYQGELRSPTTGEMMPDGTYDMLFRIYDVEFGGTPLWEEIHSTLYGNPIEVKDGILQVPIGSGEGDPLTPSVFGGADRWLEIRVETETLEPRHKIASVPYSIISENSHLLDGRTTSDFAGAVHNHSGSDITSGVVGQERVDPAIARDNEIDAAIATHASSGDAHHAKTTRFTELTDMATDAQIPDNITVEHAKTSEDADTLDGRDSAYFLSGSDDYGRSGVAADLYEGTDTLSRKYVNTTGPDRVTGSSNMPMLSVENSGTGSALNSTAQTTGIVGTALGDSGYGVKGFADGAGGRGIAGSAGGSDGRGVWGSAAGEGGRGVFGVATDTGDAENHGGYFEAQGKNGRGVYGLAKGESGVGVRGTAEGLLGKGLYGEATSGAFGIGVLGVGADAGVYSDGDLVVTAAYRGFIGPDGGAPFPRPAYDSGWQAIDTGKTIVLSHNVGGDPDTYVVDLQFFDDGEVGLGRHQRFYGGYSTYDYGLEYRNRRYGAFWHNLTKEEIRVHCQDDTIAIMRIRVRIWVYQ